MSQNIYNEHKQGTMNCKCIKRFINKNISLYSEKVSAHDFTIKCSKLCVGNSKNLVLKQIYGFLQHCALK